MCFLLRLRKQIVLIRLIIWKVNLTKAAQIEGAGKGEFYPSFEIVASNLCNQDLHEVAYFEIFKKHEETIEKYKDSAFRESELAKMRLPPLTDRKQRIIEAINGLDPRHLFILNRRKLKWIAMIILIIK